MPEHDPALDPKELTEEINDKEEQAGDYYRDEKDQVDDDDDIDELSGGELDDEMLDLTLDDMMDAF